MRTLFVQKEESIFSDKIYQDLISFLVPILHLRKVLGNMYFFYPITNNSDVYEGFDNHYFSYLPFNREDLKHRNRVYICLDLHSGM